MRKDMVSGEPSTVSSGSLVEMMMIDVSNYSTLTMLELSYGTLLTQECLDAQYRAEAILFSACSLSSVGSSRVKSSQAQRDSHPLQRGQVS